MTWHKAMLKSVGKARVKAMTNHGMCVGDTIVFGSRITLCYDRNT